ncbi:MAG: hypothetical protein V2J42_04370 [Wenzhouxiangella sp.]|jgi:hypothetical protein|nr:hypothetical protein [Wenzhouxiangella sp.]
MLGRLTGNFGKPCGQFVTVIRQVTARSAMRFIATTLLLLTLGPALPADSSAQVETPSEDSEPSGYMDPDDRSPLAALNPANSSLEVWIGPIILGVFAFFLILFIRRYSKPRRQDQAQTDVEKRRE